ncbi:hypothetical protein TWF281_006988 [Arthrobotrys megalospora]
MASACYTCRISTSNPIVCSSCSAVQYCSPSHLSSDSTRHFSECKKIHRMSVAVFRLESYLIGLANGQYPNPNSSNPPSTEGIPQCILPFLKREAPLIRPWGSFINTDTPEFDDPTVSYSPSTNRLQLLNLYPPPPKQPYEPLGQNSFRSLLSLEHRLLIKYFRLRRSLIYAILQIENSTLALHLALENTSDICALNYQSQGGGNSNCAVHTLLRLGMDASAYEIKTAFLEDRILGTIGRQGSEIEPEERMAAIVVRAMNQINGKEGGCQCGLSGCRQKPGVQCVNAGRWKPRDGAEELMALKVFPQKVYPLYSEAYIPWILMMLVWVNDLKALETFARFEWWFVDKLNFDVVEIIKKEMVQSETIRMRKYLWGKDYSELIGKLEEQMKFGFDVVNMGPFWGMLHARQGFWNYIVVNANGGDNDDSVTNAGPPDNVALLGIRQKLFRGIPGAIEFVKERLNAARKSGMMGCRGRNLLEHFRRVNSDAGWPFPRTSPEDSRRAFTSLDSRSRIVYLID